MCLCIYVSASFNNVDDFFFSFVPNVGLTEIVALLWQHPLLDVSRVSFFHFVCVLYMCVFVNLKTRLFYILLCQSSFQLLTLPFFRRLFM